MFVYSVIKIFTPYHLENTLFISFTLMGQKRVLSLHIYKVFAMVEGRGFITQPVTQQKSLLALVTGIQLVSAHCSLVMQVVLAPPLPVPAEP